MEENINSLRFFGKAIMVVGSIGALFILLTMATSERIQPGYISITERVANPVGIILGAAILVESLITGIFLLVFADLATNILELKELTHGILKKDASS